MVRYDNTYDIDALIADLVILKTKHGGDAKVLICSEAHTYDIRCIETTGTIPPPATEIHTCTDNECDCGGVYYNDHCPVCACPGCEEDENFEPEQIIAYLMAGDQHAYEKPNEFDSELEAI